MLSFTAIIQQFEEKGEKTGWTYIHIPEPFARKLNPGDRRSFQVKGTLDDYRFEGLNLLPMGGGNFIMTLNATIRKAIRKRKGAKVSVRIEQDHRPLPVPAGLMESLEDEPAALAYFNSLTPSHRSYFMKWISSAKTEATRTKRIARTVTACVKRQDYGTMLRSNRDLSDLG